MNTLSIISSTNINGYNINVYGDFENPLFLAKDVAEWIEYDPTSINKLVSLVDEQERVRNIIPTLGGNQEVWMLTEDGLYEVLMQSRKPIAKEFKSKVKQYLKELRKTGFTATPAKLEEIILNPDLVIRLATELKSERQEKERLRLQTELQGRELKEASPKIEYFDEVLQSSSLITTTVIAKELGMSAMALNKFLSRYEVIYKSGNTWVLYSQYQNRDYTKTRTIHYTDKSGVEQTEIHTYWTEKGRLFIHGFVRSKRRAA